MTFRLIRGALRILVSDISGMNTIMTFVNDAEKHSRVRNEGNQYQDFRKNEQISSGVQNGLLSLLPRPKCF